MTSNILIQPALLRVTDANSLGPAIRSRRRAQSLRIDDAASLSGVSVDLLSRLENGKGSVRLDKLLMKPFACTRRDPAPWYAAGRPVL